MSCGCETGKVCQRLVVSQAVTFADGVLTINVPQRTFENGEKYCFVVAQEIPPETTIYAPAVITIGTGTVEYPITNRCCAPVTACALRSGYRYATRLATTGTGGSFRLLGEAACAPGNALATIDGTEPEGGGGA